MLNKLNVDMKGNQYFDYIILGLISVFLISFFSYFTSPLYQSSLGQDSAFFLVTGRMVTQGFVPYVDFFDMKGPLLFFLEALGILIYHGRFGVYLVQILFCFFSSTLIYHIARLFVDKSKAFITVILALLILSATLEGGNLTEEYSLPFVLFPIFLSLKFLLSKKPEHPVWYSMVYGACFGILSFIRITNASAIFAIVLFFAIFLCLKKRYKNLFQNMLFFIIGAILVSIPIFIYFGLHHAIPDMLYGTFVFPSIYAKTGISGRTASSWMQILHYFSPLFVGLFTGMLYYKKNKAISLFCSCVASITFLMFVMGFGYLHYFSMTIPAFSLGVIFLFDLFTSQPRFPVRHLNIICLVATLLICFSCFLTYYEIIDNSNQAALTQLINKPNQPVNESAKAQGDLIPAQDKNSVWGYSSLSYWFLINKISPSFKYLDYQESFSSYSPHVKEEINEMMEQNPPKWIVIRSADMDPNRYLLTNVAQVIREKYQLVSSESGVNLYTRND